MAQRPPLDVGQVLGSAVKLGFAATPRVLPLAIVAYAPAWLLQVPGSVASTKPWTKSLALAPALVHWACMAVLMAIVLPLLLRQLDGRDSAAPDSPRFGKRLLLVLIVSLPTGLLGLAGRGARVAIDDEGYLAALAFLSVAIFAFWLTYRLAVAPAAAVTGASTIAETFSRAWDLTQGRVLVLFFAHVGVIVPTVLVGVCLGLLLRAAGAEKGLDLGFAAAEVLATPFFLALMAVLYDQLDRGGAAVPPQPWARAPG